MATMRSAAVRVLRHPAARAGAGVRVFGFVSSSAIATSRGGSARAFSAKPPGVDPLELLRKSSETRNLCDESGYRLPGTHWAFSVAVPELAADMAPNLRMVNFQRVCDLGIDFVLKRGPHSDLLGNDRPSSFLYSMGKYKPGETVEQWRADGCCKDLKLDEILGKIPHYTITEMVASKRAAKEMADKFANPSDEVSKERTLMEKQSHFVELVQQTRIQLENGDVGNEEIEECLKAYRFVPERMERMIGGPDNIMWDRWEWLRATGGSPEEPSPWAEPKHLLPY